MTDDAIVTVVIPSFNAIAHLPACIDAAVEVLGPALGTSVQIHIQDGQSTDGSTAWLEALKQPGIAFSVEEDTGIYDAMNRALAQVKTPFVYFLGADDRLQADFLTLLPLLTDSQTVYYGNVLFSHDMRPYDGRFTRTKLVYRNICHQAIVYPTSLLQQDPFKPAYRIYADWELNLRLMAAVRFEYHPLNLAIYENTGGASAVLDDPEFSRDRHALFRRHFGLPYYLMSVTAPLAVSVYQAISPPRRPDNRKP